MKKYKHISNSEKELRNYFNHSAAIFGFKSSHPTPSSIYGGNLIPNTDPYVGLIDQISTNRAIYKALHSIPSIYRRALDATYNEEYIYPVEIITVFGIKSGATLCTSLLGDDEKALKELLKLCKKLKNKKLSEDEQKILFLIRSNGHRLYHDSHLIYYAERIK